jgi:hypothetical protein
MNTRVEVTPPSDDGSLVIDGSADGVATRAQAMLQGLGVTAEVQHDSEEVRLLCSTASGKHFCLHLTEMQTETSMSSSVNDKPSLLLVTHIRMEWEKEADVPTEIRVKAGLGSLNMTKGLDLATGHNL